MLDRFFVKTIKISFKFVIPVVEQNHFDSIDYLVFYPKYHNSSFQIIFASIQVFYCITVFSFQFLYLLISFFEFWVSSYSLVTTSNTLIIVNKLTFIIAIVIVFIYRNFPNTVNFFLPNSYLI